MIYGTRSRANGSLPRSSRDPEAAGAVALVTAVVVFAPLTALRWEIEADAWPYIAASSLLELVYFALLGAAYRRAEVSVVYPLARGLAPVLVLVAGVLFLDAGTTAAQAVGVVLVGLGVFLVRGLWRPADAAGVLFGLAIACSIAGYRFVPPPASSEAMRSRTKGLSEQGWTSLTQ